MTGNITRHTFDPANNYTSVRMQQGRLQLDADWNEQVDIQNYLRQVQVVDMIGAGSGASKVDPVLGVPSTASFELRVIQAIPNGDEQPQATDIAILPGHFYTRGVLCELAPSSVFTVKKVKQTNKIQLQVSPSLTIDGRRLRVGDWLVKRDSWKADPSTSPDDSDASPSAMEPVTADDSPPTDTADTSASIDAAAAAPSDDTEDIGDRGNADTPAKASPTLPNLDGWRITRIVDARTFIIEVAGDLSAIGDGAPEAVQRLVTYTSQPDLPSDSARDRDHPISQPPGGYFAYLDVWQRHITAVEDPTIREVALGVPDTTTRTKTVWQLKLRPAKVDSKDIKVPVATAEELPVTWTSFADNERLRAPQIKACARLCDNGNGIGTNGRLGNYLYRVEIHTGNHPSDSEAPNDAQPRPVTFKWSRDNGSVVSAVKSIEGNVIRIAKASQDIWVDSRPNQWLELLTEAQELQGEPGVLVPLKSITDTRLEFNDARLVGSSIPKNVTKVRRWDHTETVAPQGSIPIRDEWIELENGIKVKFVVPPASPSSVKTSESAASPAPAADGDVPDASSCDDDTDSETTTEQQPPIIYRTGDYWLIPSRSATNDIEWPTDQADTDVSNQVRSASTPLFQPRNGTEHRYALLGIVDVDESQHIKRVFDQRILFPPLLRALDKRGDTISGSLTIRQNLNVDQTTTTQDLKVLGQFASNIYRGKAFTLALDPTNNAAPDYGQIQAVGADDTKRIEFSTVENTTRFTFLNGDVEIGQSGTPQNLTVAGTIEGIDMLKNGQTVALQDDLIAHTSNTTGNPHNVTAAQVDGNDHKLINRINDDANNGERINQNRLNVDALEGEISSVNDKVGTLEGNITTLRTNLNDHQIADNPHGIDADKISALALSGGTLTGHLSAPTLSIGPSAIPSLEPSPALYVQGHLYVDGTDTSEGRIFADGLRVNNTASLAIAPTSKVGIGASPDTAAFGNAKLGVQGDTKIIGNLEVDHSLTLAINQSDHVSIGGAASTIRVPDGTRPPDPKLYVKGDLYIDVEDEGKGGSIFARTVESSHFVQLSSSALKDDVTPLSSKDATDIVGQLNVVQFRYHQDHEGDLSTGFIAEQVPDIIASADHHGVKLMDTVAILTKVVQDNRKMLQLLSQRVRDRDEEIAVLRAALNQLQE